MALERILARTRSDVAERKRHRPLGELRAGLTPSSRSLAAALRAGRTGFILECKKASPSQGLLRPDYDPVDIARTYAPFADAISVLTDGPFFQGSHEHLRRVSEAVALPVLCKDFIVDPWQVFEARAHGADAVLLMLSVLDDAGYRDCAAAAAEAGVETLTEVHSAAELDRALALDAPVIGINNRDLTTLRVSLDTVRTLAPMVPVDRVLICESGIETHDQVCELRPLVDGFLVGTSMMRAPDLAAAVRGLVFGVTKICGLTRSEDAEAAWSAGATHGGLIFADESPRRVSNERAAEIRAAAPLAWVGVFVNAPITEVAETAARLGLSAVQVHGEEPPQYVEALRPQLPDRCEIWKAVRVRPGEPIPSLVATRADRLLLDTWHPARHGGTGERFDWSRLGGNGDLDRIVLSGGLTPELTSAAEATGAWGLDFNSGVEASPGIKEARRVSEVLAARRGHGREGQVTA